MHAEANGGKVRRIGSGKMKWSLTAVCIGFLIDAVLGDPRSVPHPVILIGKMISFLEQKLRKVFPGTKTGERTAGIVLWVLVAACSLVIPVLVLWGCQAVSPWLRLGMESIMCWQILAARSLRDESMKVYYALKKGPLQKAQKAVAMIVGRDTGRLDEAGVTRACVETIAENTSDGVIAPLFFMAIGGAPLGFFYKAVNTMDSMLGYTDPPYTNIGFFPAKADDVVNFIPARLAALLMLPAGGLLHLPVKEGWRIFMRDRYHHASPNSAQTESVCAGLLQVRLAGDAWYHGILHKKPYIGDPVREISREDIVLADKLMYLTSILALILFCGIRWLTLVL